MGLADLKKRATPSEPRRSQPHTSVDEFINDAVLYAMGQDAACKTVTEVATRQNCQAELFAAERDADTPENLLSFHRSELSETVKATDVHPLKRGTYTLGDDTLAKLSELAAESDISRSRMLRFLVNYFAQLNPQQRKLLYRQFMID